MRAALDAAAARGAAIGVGPIDPGVCAVPRDGFIERLEAESLLIRCMNDQRIPALFVKGETVQLSVLSPSGFDLCVVTVLGTWESEEHGVRRRGVRVTIPRELRRVQRRLSRRISVGFDLSPRVIVRAPSVIPASPADTWRGIDGAGAAGEPIVPEALSSDLPELGRGFVLDLSESGARIRLVVVPEGGPPRRGSLIQLAAVFPALVPSFDCRAEVMYLAPTARTEGWILGLCFREGRPDLSRAIHQLELRRAQRMVR
ncbi:MAG: hypothetical protein GC172_05550 [Phycisphaera sp.]|nr:hypothetical protein [Phycisphaera sp.]